MQILKDPSDREVEHYSVRRLQLLLLVSALAGIYVFASLLVFQNQSDLERMQTAPLDTAKSGAALGSVWRHDGSYFREFADRLQFYGHEPKVVSKLYRAALRTAPADYETFLSYGYYLLSRNCCRDTVIELLKETIRRCPTNPRMYRVAATYLMAVHEKDRAIPYFRRALQLNPDAAPELYRILDENLLDLHTFLEVTPHSPQAYLQLASYIAAKPEAGSLLNQVLADLNRSSLSTQQRMTFARLALKCGRTDLVRRQAALAAADPDVKGEALGLLAEAALVEKNWSGFEYFSEAAEKAYIDRGADEEAAQYAFSAAQRIAELSQAKSKEKLLKIVSQFPRFAPAYSQLAVFSRNSSPSLSLYYAKKATEFSPENFNYRMDLANAYMLNFQAPEAEKIYAEFLSNPDYRSKAYLGLSRCKLEKGDSLGAVSILKDGLQAVPDSKEISLALAELYRAQGDFQNAAEASAKYAELSASDAQAFNLAGDAYLQIGTYEKARLYYQKALESDSRNVHALEALSRLKTLGF
jgi:tetratricopeptide (TPR) repeat protein